MTEAKVNKFKLVMENAVRPFMENRPAVYLLLLLLLTTGTYTASDLVGMYMEESPVIVEPVPAPAPKAAPATTKQTIIREIIRQPADCQPLINKSLSKHEKNKHG